MICALRRLVRGMAIHITLEGVILTLQHHYVAVCGRQIWLVVYCFELCRPVLTISLLHLRAVSSTIAVGHRLTTFYRAPSFVMYVTCTTKFTTRPFVFVVENSYCAYCAPFQLVLARSRFVLRDFAFQNLAAIYQFWISQLTQMAKPKQARLHSFYFLRDVKICSPQKQQLDLRPLWKY